jgi:dienelactone hydrolase
MFEFFEGNYAWNLSVLTLVEDVGTISEPMEAFQSVAHLAKAPPATANEAWYQALVKLGEKLERLADRDVSENHPFTAARKYHRSSMYFIRAERMASHRDPRRLMTYKRAIKNYRLARDLAQEGVEFLDIPYKGGLMPALFIPAVKGKPAPIIIHLQGFDSIKETQFPVVQEYRRRGLSCLIVDQPGSGGALRLHGLTAEFETEQYVSKIVDFVLSRPDMKTDQIGLAGISMGGYFAPRAAAFEPRIKACAAWGAFYDAEALATRPDQIRAPSVPNPADHGMWSFGIESEKEYWELRKRLKLKGVVERIKCPLYIIHGENDRQVPVQQALDTFESATTRNKKLKIFTLEEGGAEHCQIDNRTFSADCLADWFSETFGTSAPAKP